MKKRIERTLFIPVLFGTRRRTEISCGAFPYLQTPGQRKNIFDFSRPSTWEHLINRQKACVAAFPKALFFSWTPPDRSVQPDAQAQAYPES